MIGRLSHAGDVRAAALAALAEVLTSFKEEGPIVVLSHFDADGLCASAILTRALSQAGWIASGIVIGKTESPWDAEVGNRIRALAPAGLIVADLGTRPEPVLPGCPTLVIDHHVPTGEPEGAVTISGNGLDPEPTASLLAWWAAFALGDQSDLQWLAAIGLIGDMADDRGFPELAEAQTRWGKTALRDATSLINAPRRTATADTGRRSASCSGRPDPSQSQEVTTPMRLHCTRPKQRSAQRWMMASACRPSSPATWR